MLQEDIGSSNCLKCCKRNSLLYLLNANILKKALQLCFSLRDNLIQPANNGFQIWAGGMGI